MMIYTSYGCETGGAMADGKKEDADAGEEAKVSSPVEELSSLARIAKSAESQSEGPRSADKMADQLIDDLATDPGFGDDLQKSPEMARDFATVAKLKSDAAQVRNYDLEIAKSNGALYLTVVISIGSSLVLVVLSIAIIAMFQISMMSAPINGTITIAIPDGLIALGSAAVGALAGLLTPLSSRR